jgi:hypothetical protein
MSNEPDLFKALDATHTHRTSIIVANPRTGAMWAFTPLRKHAKFLTTRWDPDTPTYERSTDDVSFRAIIELIYDKCNGWRIVADNSSPGKIESRAVMHADGTATWYVNAPEHGLALPQGYSVHPCPMQGGQGTPRWYITGPDDREDGDRTIECVHTSIEDAVDAAWDEVES